MSDSLDPLLLNSLPAAIRTVVEAQTRALVAEQAARLHLQAENADLRASNAELKALNARLEHLSHELRRARFGPSSEKLSSDQLELAFEDIEVAVVEAQQSHENAVAARTGEKPGLRTPRGPRALPKNLPREERVIEPASLTWSPLSRRRQRCSNRWRRRWQLRATMATRMR